MFKKELILNFVASLLISACCVWLIYTVITDHFVLNGVRAYGVDTATRLEKAINGTPVPAPAAPQK